MVTLLTFIGRRKPNVPFVMSTAQHVRSDKGKAAQVKIWKEMHDILLKINPETAVIVDG